MDGSASKVGCGAGVVLQGPDGFIAEYALRLDFKASNNEDEYKALLAGLSLAAELGTRKLRIYSDSQLMVEQVNEVYEAKELRMKRYLQKVREKLKGMGEVEILQHRLGASLGNSTRAQLDGSHSTAPKRRNTAREQTGSLTPNREGRPLHAPWTQAVQMVVHMAIPPMPGTLRVRVRTTRGTRGDLRRPRRREDPSPEDRKSWLFLAYDPQRRLGIRQKVQPMPEIRPHPPSTGHPLHLNGGATAFRHVGHGPARAIPEGPGGHTIILVTDNGPQFASVEFDRFCDNLSIEHRFASVAHPQANRQMEVTNRILLQSLKKRLGEARNCWVEAFPSILWVYRTTPKVATGESSFCLTFGAEAVIPVEIGLSSFRAENYDEHENFELLRNALDLVLEKRERALLRTAAYQQKVARYYNSRVKKRTVKPEDLLLRRAEVSDP
ncbi:uncharacterized protein LOC143857079 [Tasmannia lanceolata]|uniref:uncharacterized protein LOC143857079 n=1 Tax=Tasmannia lanceolata TaxID=3420 RepID=UPI004063FC18